jgi:hypothetical protein
MTGITTNVLHESGMLFSKFMDNVILGLISLVNKLFKINTAIPLEGISNDRRKMIMLGRKSEMPKPTAKPTRGTIEIVINSIPAK